MSDDGRYVVFHSDAWNLVVGDTNGRADVFVRDRMTNRTRRVSINASGAQGDSRSEAPRISGDGHWIIFYSDSTNLVPGDTNGVGDLFRVPNFD